ncbi:hypothetical protein QFC24_003452 [Naganishia onofrii]|uniref:Uncharacterized protein n=1 Tax=Naganishia onofrii TaxID=1851511 RepID=A0ACC2XJ61_9TREE|nr:hypothetical protein QFC24_003452 [Naganishia onofrii]
MVLVLRKQQKRKGSLRFFGSSQEPVDKITHDRAQTQLDVDRVEQTGRENTCFQGFHSIEEKELPSLKQKALRQDLGRLERDSKPGGSDADSAYGSEASGDEGVKDAPAPGSYRPAGEQKHSVQKPGGHIEGINKAGMEGNDLRGGGYPRNHKVVTKDTQDDSSGSESDGGEKKARARVVVPNATNDPHWKKRLRR